MLKAIVAMGLTGLLAGGLAVTVASADSKQVVGNYTVHMAADFNGDGKVTLEEHLAWARSIFEQMDLDGDGFISAQEMAQFQLKQLASKSHPSGGQDAHLDEPPVMIPVAKFSSAIDLDGDGRVSLAEHLAIETKTFKALANSEGVITAKEIVEKDKQAKAEIEQKLRLLREQKSASSQQRDAKFDFQK
jgi:Ca2+-binding EF-hand superfamily protein